MERDFSAGKLEAGHSIEAIAREVGKHPSTVAYWVQKHGLTSTRARRHAARGGIDRAVLTELVMEGLSVRGIATRLSVSTATVRHWLGRHGLETGRTAALRAAREGRARGDDAVARACRRHGATLFVLRGDGYYRCAQCTSESVVRRRARVRAIVVVEAGGRCIACGYDRDPAALQLHHLDPATKSFNVSNGDTRSLTRMREEAAKCVLLCAVCHAEVESGSRRLAVPSSERSSPE
jgi:transposase